MSKPAAKVPEPSMEEILASIRRIISDESAGPAQPAAAGAPAPASAHKAPPAAPAPAARKPAPPPAPEEPDVLELTDVVETRPQESYRPAARAETRPEIRPESFRKNEPDVMFRDPEPAPRFSPPPAPRLDDQLLSQDSRTAVSSAFGALANSMFSGDSRTVDELVREMLKPMLKAWLDDNLPSLVERLVRAEIERVSRGR